MKLVEDEEDMDCIVEKLYTRKTRGNKVVKKIVCHKNIGILCKKNTYKPCTNMLADKKAKKSETDQIKYGLFAEKDIET